MKSKEPRINLLRYRQEAISAKKSGMRFAIIMGLAAILCLGAIAGAWWSQNQKLQALQQKNQLLQEDVDQLVQEVALLESGLETPGDVLTRENLIKQLSREPRLKADQLLEVYEMSDPGVTIGSMQVKAEESVTMSAYCQSQAEFIQFLDHLQGLDYIKEVKNVSSRRNDKTGEVNFNITLVWGVK